MITPHCEGRVLQPEPAKQFDPGGKSPIVIPNRIFVSQVRGTESDEEYDQWINEESRTELDSHANMPVVGRNAYILADTDKVVDVSPFTPDYSPMSVPVVDAAICYDCPYDGKPYILVVRNALYVPSMSSNLIPPFIMREKGIIVNDIAKVQIPDPMVEDHSIYFKETSFRIPLSLYGTFSYFPSRKPTTDELAASDEIYLVTPTRFNPHDSSYAINEAAMLDWEGEMIPARERRSILLEDIDEDLQVSSLFNISASESTAIDSNMISVEEEVVRSENFQRIPQEADEVANTLSSISPMLDDTLLCQRLNQRSEISSMMASLGSTNARNSRYLFDEENPEDNTDAINNDDLNPPTDDEFMNNFQESIKRGDVDLDEIMASGISAGKSRGVKAEHLSKIWKIDVDTARRTLDVTTQHSRHKDNPKLARNYGTNDRMLRYKRVNEYFFTDTFFATKKGGRSSRGHTCCQLFVTDKGFVYVIPMRAKSDVMQAVKQFAKEVGAPDAIICDAAREQIKLELRKFLNEIGTVMRVLEENTPWANKAELYIGIIKEAVRKDMRISNCPLPFWDYCVERRARIHNLTAKDAFHLHGQNPHTMTMHETGDISNLATYDWYQWCYYREQGASFPHGKEVLGRVLGPARGHGNEMAQWVLKANGNVVPRRTLRPLTVSELNSTTENERRQVFDALIERRWGNSICGINTSKPENDDNSEEFDYYSDNDERPNIHEDIEDAVDATGKLINQQPAYDKVLNAEIAFQRDENSVSMGKVKRRALDHNGKTSGTYNDNPYLNTMVYEVEFDDGQIKEYSANIIAENMLQQVDIDGYSSASMRGIIDFYRDDKVAVPKEQREVLTNTGQKRLRKTTKGWKLQVEWNDGRKTWIPLSVMKESNPVEVAEFAVARNIAEEPAFAWWVPYVIAKRKIILSKVKARIRQTTHKYGVEVPRDVKQAYAIDTKNGDNKWRDAIAKEMREIGVAVEILPSGKQAPVGWSKVTGHMVFDVKMDFTRKARWVLDGHKTSDLKDISTYAGVVSRESVRIALTYAALNGLDVCAADIKNAYLQSPSSQKNYIICGEEFGIENVGKVGLIHRALYGGKSAGRDFRNHLRACMRHLDFKSCPADPDVWMRPATKADGTEYYEYILLYTDDCLCISENAERVLREGIGKYFALKEASIGPPEIYLGARLRNVVLENGVKCWSSSSSQYVQAAVKNVEEYIKQRIEQGDKRYSLPRKAEAPMQSTYRPELDVSPELDSRDAAYFQSLIGILRWIVEIGRVDVCLECSVMSSHLALPREGHLNQVLHIFGYLKSHHNAEMVFDPSEPADLDRKDFELRDWTTSEFGHLIGKEEIPENAPQPRGMGFTTRAKVDADHAADSVTRKSRTAFLVYLNCALIYWLSKKQASVNASSHGSEFTSMKHCCEYLRGLRYKLRMMGIPVVGPTFIYGDNQSVLANTTIPESTLKKKSQSIAYHYVREGVARDEWRTSYVNTHENESDLLSKVLPAGEKRRKFVRRLLHHVYD